MFLSVDGTIWIQLINFAIFFTILNLVFLRPVGRAIRERRQYINSLTHDYDRYQAQASECQAKAESIRAAARREAAGALAKSRAEASNESARIAQEFHGKATTEVASAHKTVDAELQAARTAHPQTAQDLASLMITRALPESV
jgi:F-type H+-transporting ATPase subunit b